MASARLVLLFPGQGSSSVGMGRDFYEKFPAAKTVFDRAHQAAGFDLLGLCFNGPADKLTQTEYQQPCVLAVSIAIYEVLRHERDFEVAAAIGHSLGEYSALVAAGALGLEDAISLTRKRGRYMQNAVPLGEGGMAALLGSDVDAAQKLCDAVGEGVWVANLNGGGQVVISGATDALKKAGDLAKEHGVRRFIPLKVSAPFHCPMMSPAAKALDADLRRIDFNDFAFPVISNVDGLPNADAGKVRDLLFRQVTDRVLFEKCVHGALQMTPGIFIECGPGATLTNMAKRIINDVPCISISAPGDISQLDAI